MSKRYWTVLIVTVIATFLSVNALYASKEFKDVIKMNEKSYAKHTKGIVTFTHKKHSKDYAAKYPEFFKNGCGTCHHDKNHKPLTNLKEGDEVQACIACHKKPGYITGKEARGLTKKQKLEYQANAMHDNCRGCHHDYDRKMKLRPNEKGAAPTSCKQCHGGD
jgi:Class III cytochrome C family